MKQRTASRNQKGKLTSLLGRLPLYLTQFGFYPVSSHTKNFQNDDFFEIKGVGKKSAIPRNREKNKVS